MELNTLELQNFISYKKLHFDFSKNGLYLITGANGSGKSTLYEGILWCLYGKTLKKVKLEELINDNEEKNCFSKLTFTKNKTVYKVARYRNHDDYGDELKLFIDKKEYQGKDTQAKIESIIGMTDKLFVIANLISNDEASNILNIQRAKRIDIFEEIFGLSGLDSYEKKITEGIKDTNNKIANNLNKLIELKTKQETTQNSIDDYLKNKKTRINELKNEIKNLETIRDDIDIEAEEKILVAYKIILKQKSEAEKLESEIDEAITTMSSINKNIAKYAEEKHYIEKNIKEFKHTSTCYTCGSVLKDEVASDLSKALKEQLEEISQALKDEHKLLEQVHNEEAEKEKQLEEFLSELDKLYTVIYKLLKKNNFPNAEDYKQGITAFDKKFISELAEHFNIERFNNKIKGLQDELDELTNDTFVKDAKKRLTQIEKEIPEYTKKEQELKELLDYWSFWKKAFDVKADVNIKKFRIQKIINKFNEILADYVEKFFDKEDVKISFKDNLDEVIRFDKRQRSYKMLSKGQKKVVDNCINFTFFEMARLMTKSQFPLIMVDECVDGLDADKSSNTLDVLSALARDNVIYIVSHDATATDKVDGHFQVFFSDDEETSKIKTIF